MELALCWRGRLSSAIAFTARVYTVLVEKYCNEKGYIITYNTIGNKQDCGESLRES